MGQHASSCCPDRRAESRPQAIRRLLYSLPDAVLSAFVSADHAFAMLLHGCLLGLLLTFASLGGGPCLQTTRLPRSCKTAP